MDKRKRLIINTTIWLKFDSHGHDHVNTLSCKVCRQYKDKLLGMHTCYPAFMEGTSNVSASPFKDHAVTDIHKCAISLFSE